MSDTQERSALEIALFTGDWETVLKLVPTCNKGTVFNAFLYTPIPDKLKETIIDYCQKEHSSLILPYVINRILERKKIDHSHHIVILEPQDGGVQATRLVAHIADNKSSPQELYGWCPESVQEEEEDVDAPQYMME